MHQGAQSAPYDKLNFTVEMKIRDNALNIVSAIVTP